MRIGSGVVAGLFVLAGVLKGQQPAQPAQQPAQQPVEQKPQSQPAQAAEPPIVIYKIDLVGNTTVFAMNEPTLEGDTYVFTSLPDRQPTRLPKEKVKAITRRSTDFSKEVVYKVELLPTGTFLARDEPVKKGKIYLIHAWKQGDLLSVSERDIKKITRLTGMEAFKAEEIELGLRQISGELMFPSGAQGAAGSGPAPPGGAAPGQGNWTYQGQPGATDAYAPGNATVSRPGDTPMMAPEPTRAPR